MTSASLILLALAAAPSPSPSPLATPSRWAPANWVLELRDGGYSTLRKGLHPSDLELAVFPDGGLYIGETMLGISYALRAERVSPTSFRLVSLNDSRTGTWRWLAADRAFVEFGQAREEFVRLRDGESPADIVESYLVSTTKRHWPEVVGSYKGQDGGLLVIEPGRTIRWDRHVITGDLYECHEDCRPDAGVTLCFASNFTGLGDESRPGWPLSVTFKRAGDGGLTAFRTVEPGCSGTSDSYERTDGR